MLSSYLRYFCFQMTDALQKASEITPPYYIYTFKTHKLSRQRASNVINSTFPCKLKALTTQHSQL